jgi:molecular chaperone DnaK (HSP70)
MIYGIDLGTTFSAIGYANELGKPVCINIGKKTSTIPSAVLFVDEKKVYVGEDALANSWRPGSKLVELAKRSIGLQGGLKWKVGDWTYVPEEISALVLKQVAKRTVLKERSLPAPREAVISHPQWFGVNQKEATHRAAKLARLEPVATISEPYAAAVAYGVLDEVQANEETVLVFDLGGGTFDVTLAQIGKNFFHAIASEGDSQLGGGDWDNLIINRIKEIYQNKTQSNITDVQSDEERAGLRKTVEDAKELLSDQNEVRIKVEVGGALFPVEITRGEFEIMSEPLLGRCRKRCEKLLSDSGRSWADVDKILMVGSSTKMPMVQELVRTITGQEPLIYPDPKLMVVRGAAIWADWVLKGKVEARWAEDDKLAPSGLEIDERIDIRGCTAHGIGVLATHGAKEFVKLLVRQNQSTPLTVEQIFSTNKDDATAIEVQVYEGDSEDPADDTRIGSILVDNLPARPKGQPVNVAFRIDLAGRMEVEVVDVDSGRREIKELRAGLVSSAERGDISFDDRLQHLDEVQILGD